MNQKNGVANPADDLRRRAEDKIKGLSDHQDQETSQLLYELRVHQVELEMQNDDLRRTQHELESSRAGYFDLYNLAPVGYCTADQQGVVLEANLTAATVLGVARGALVNQPLSRFVHPDDQDSYARHCRQLFATGRPQACELRLQRPDSTSIWVWLEANLIEGGAVDSPSSRIVISDITARKQMEEQIARSLQEKTVMLKEIHHRVKNNLTVIYSLLSLQAKRITGQDYRLMFEESKNRVMSMAMIHEKLYQSDDLAYIDFKEYLEDLVGRIVSTYQLPNVTAVVEMGDLALDVNVGIPCGLIVNELVSNSLKYAFPEGRKGVITLGINRNNEGDNVLTVGDNGIGLPQEFDLRSSSSSLGFQLVNGLTGQIKGTIVLSRDEGTKFTITFPATSPQK